MKKIFSILVLFGITFLNAQKFPGGGNSSSCNIAGPSNLALNQTGVYSISSNLAQCTQCHDWDIDGLNLNTSSNAQIITDDRLNTVSIKRIGNGSITLKVTYFTEEGCKECSLILASCGGGPVTCSAVVNRIWGVPVNNLNFPQFNVEINVDVFTTNPFPNPAQVLIQWDPLTMNGFQVAGGLYDVGPNQTILLPSQYLTVGSPNSTAGYYSPMIVRYTDLVTGQICTVNLNPLVFNGTHHMRTTNLSITPNPVKSVLNIEGENLSGLNISFFDTLGNEIIKNYRVEKSINVEELKSGIYIYKIMDKDNVIQEGKIIKE